MHNIVAYLGIGLWLLQIAAGALLRGTQAGKGLLLAAPATLSIAVMLLVFSIAEPSVTGAVLGFGLAIALGVLLMGFPGRDAFTGWVALLIYLVLSMVALYVDVSPDVFGAIALCAAIFVVGLTTVFQRSLFRDPFK